MTDLRATILAIVGGLDTEVEIVSQWKKCFPYMVTLGINLPDTFKDISWHNDACPCFEDKVNGIQLWIDYEDPAMRDVPQNTRYMMLRKNWKGDWIEHYQSDSPLSILAQISLNSRRT